MLFSSMTFIYVFLPIVCLLYLIVKKDLRNFVLLFASLIFYAWGEPNYLAIMILTIVVNYFGAIFLERYSQYKKIILFATVTTNLAFLIYFKYFNFLLDNINHLFKTNIDFIHVVMPIGISFYTFQAMSYIFDVYRGEVKPQRNFYKLALYISLFPQLIAGPILKYSDIEPQLDNRVHSFDNVSMGIKRFIIGLSKKMLIANVLGEVADKVFSQAPDTFSHLTAWLGVGSYMLQIYYDFSGYSDMAIGLGLIFGFKFMENFNYPYYVKSMTEAWHKWHISLSNWFRNYVFGFRWYSWLPNFVRKLGIWKILRRLNFKRSYVNVMVVFFLIGLWHGASWTFVLWGVWNGLFLVVENLTGLNRESDNSCVKFLKHVYAVLVGLLGFVFFRSESLSYAIGYFKNMFGLLAIHDVKYTLSYYFDNLQIFIFILAFICCAPIFSKMLYIRKERWFLRGIVNAWLIILFVLSTAVIASSTYNPFIYFRF